MQDSSAIRPPVVRISLYNQPLTVLSLSKDYRFEMTLIRGLRMAGAIIKSFRFSEIGERIMAFLISLIIVTIAGIIIGVMMAR